MIQNCCHLCKARRAERITITGRKNYKNYTETENQGIWKTKVAKPPLPKKCRNIEKQNEKKTLQISSNGKEKLGNMENINEKYETWKIEVKNAKNIENRIKRWEKYRKPNARNIENRNKNREKYRKPK